jgi:hypothetical protein
VEFRDGPAAVTECFVSNRGSSSLLAIVTLMLSAYMLAQDEKAGRTELGSQKTYQRITCRVSRGTKFAYVTAYGFLLLQI